MTSIPTNSKTSPSLEYKLELGFLHKFSQERLRPSTSKNTQRTLIILNGKAWIEWKPIKP